MRVLLFNPSTGYYTRAVSNPLGLLCIASFLKREGHQVKLTDRCVSNVSISKSIKEFNPQLIGISEIVMCSEGEYSFRDIIEYYNGNIQLSEIKEIVYKENGSMDMLFRK